MAASSYDMFAKKERTKKESLAVIMVSSAETMQYGQTSCDYYVENEEDSREVVPEIKIKNISSSSF